MCWEMIDPEDNLDRSIMLDFLYSTLEFCFRKGFPLLESCYFFQLSYEILHCCKSELNNNSLNMSYNIIYINIMLTTVVVVVVVIIVVYFHSFSIKRAAYFVNSRSRDRTESDF